MTTKETVIKLLDLAIHEMNDKQLIKRSLDREVLEQLMADILDGNIKKI